MAVFTILSGCRQEKVYRIGISQCSQDDWRAKMNEEVLREIMLHEDATVEIRSANDDNTKQIADIRYFADNGFDIIIAAPNEADAITPVIKEVYDRGIPVIIFDRDVNGDSYTARIGTDNEGIGRAAGRYAARMPRPRQRAPKAIELRGLKGSTPALGRHEGFADEFTREGGEIVATGYGDWNQSDAERVADSLLTLHPDVDIIYAHNDRMAIGASEVARRKGLGDIKIIGIDAAPEIGIQAVADSVIDVTFLYPTEGHRLVKTALAILKGEPYEKETILPVSSPVDISNADILLLQNQSLLQETAKMKELKTRIDDYWSKHSAQTSLFYASMVILALVFFSLFMVLRAYWQRKRHQRVLMEQNRRLEEQGREQKLLADSRAELNEQLTEAIRSKLAFYTNVSHDLRTPLTLIAEPIAQLAAAANLTPRQHNLVLLADKNTKILRRLINQILDFRKFENGKLSLNLSEVDFGKAAAEWLDSFREVARRRDIKLTLDPPTGEGIHLALDAEKMERIFFNLISNAIKYTPDNGSIRVSYAVEDDNLILRVADTGIGIPDEDLGSIFDRFFMVDQVRPHGSGIGLSLVKAFVELHGGSITVSSQVGKGSVFTVAIPVTHVAEVSSVPEKLISQDDINAELARIDPRVLISTESPAQNPSGPDEAPHPHADVSSPTGDDTVDGKPRLLIVDDNADIRNLVTDLMGDDYEVHQAADGREGLAKAARLVPDIIVCDIMMPVMDGLECCRRIKAEVSTSHIPVVMLTACSLDEQRVEGYESGADGYIAKPFSGDVLKARCRSLLDNRKRIKDLWQGGADVVAQPTTLPKVGAQSDSAASSTTKPAQPASAAPSSPAAIVGNVDPDNEFYARFLKVFNEEISNPNLNVEQLASRMGLGHSQFYRKIKALTNYTPVELMRHLRLKQGRHLLTTTSRSISEIAYEVGFSSPAYFTKCYRIAFGETPSELRDSLAL